MATTMTNNINKVIEKSRVKYNEVLQSPYVGMSIKVDGYETKGQLEENTRRTNVKEENTYTVTASLETPVHKGSLVEIQRDYENPDDILRGLVISRPNKTPVDWYFYVLAFKANAKRVRSKPIYARNGDKIGDEPDIVDEIPCFVQRVGQRERMVDAGIDSDSVNSITTTNNWDIKKDDILYIGSDKYKVTDINELETDMFTGYMTYYRE